METRRTVIHGTEFSACNPNVSSGIDSGVASHGTPMQSPIQHGQERRYCMKAMCERCNTLRRAYLGLFYQAATLDRNAIAERARAIGQRAASTQCGLGELVAAHHLAIMSAQSNVSGKGEFSSAGLVTLDAELDCDSTAEQAHISKPAP